LTYDNLSPNPAGRPSGDVRGATRYFPDIIRRAANAL
jgi:hypothetical protein